MKLLHSTSIPRGYLSAGNIPRFYEVLLLLIQQVRRYGTLLAEWEHGL